MEKTIDFKINQFNYLSYNDLLGPAKIYYTNMKDERIETDVELVQNEVGKSFLINGIKSNVLGNEMDISLGVKYLDDELHSGELRFSGDHITDNYFTDPANSAISKLGVTLSALKYLSGNLQDDLQYSSSAIYYYPSKFDATENGNIFTFYHSNEGYPSLLWWSYKVKGLAVIGLNARNSATGSPYDLLSDIVLIKY